MPKNGIVQWGWSDMEELLQCPVCLDIPAVGIVEQCRRGHHICASCKSQVDSCPLCKCGFHGTRNFVVEELVRHYEVLKNTMMLNNIVTETKIKKKKPKAKLNASAPNFANLPRRKLNTPNINKGRYPCRVGDCDVEFPASRLLNHVRACHSDVLTESAVDFTDSYDQTWEVPFKTKKPINKNSLVVSVRGIGIIFLTAEILHSGHLIVIVQTGMKFTHAQKFLACIELFSNSLVHSYNTRLISVRDNIESIMQKHLCFTLNKNQLKNMCVDKKFQLKIRLSRFNDMDTNVLTRPNAEQINNIAGLRASLVQQEQDKKLIKALESDKKSVSANGPVAGRSSGPKKHGDTHLEQLISELLTASMGGIRIISNGESENGPLPPPNVTRSEPVAGRRRKNRNRRNRDVTNGTGPPTDSIL